MISLSGIIINGLWLPVCFFGRRKKKSLIVIKYDTSHSSKRLVALFCLLVYSKVVWCDWPSSEC